DPGGRRRALSRYLFPEKYPRPQDDQRDQSRRAVVQPCHARVLFRFARRRGRRAAMDDRSGDLVGDWRHVARAFCNRADDRSRISTVDARDHLRDQRGLSRSRWLAVLVWLRRQTFARSARKQREYGGRPRVRKGRAMRLLQLNISILPSSAMRPVSTPSWWWRSPTCLRNCARAARCVSVSTCGFATLASP